MALSIEVVRNAITAAYNEDPHVSTYMSPNRPTHIDDVYREQFTPGSAGLAPIYGHIVYENTEYKTPDLMILYNLLRSHGETPQFGWVHQGWRGNESKVIRAFHLDEQDGTLLAHQFIMVPEELEELLIPKNIINNCFPYYEGLRAARNLMTAEVQAKVHLQGQKVDPKYGIDSPYYYEDGVKIWRT